ncbi:phosphoesterase [Spirochaetia bacterium]|nr:phosphoesterase [Spirochaetia bacterium]
MYEPLPVPQQLLDFIREGTKFIVAGHKEPDGDCVGSQLGLCSALTRLGKQALPCSAGPFKRIEVKPYEGCFTAAPSEEDRRGARIIVMDCSLEERTGDLGPLLEGLPVAVVDHHASENPWGEVVYLDPGAPSVTFMTLELIEALGLTPTAEEAELLFFGLCTDTGFFRHVDDGGAETFICASRLVRGGANPKKAFHAIHGGKSLNSRILMGRILSKARSYFDGKLILSREDYEDTLAFGQESRDSDSLYQLLQSVEGVAAIGIIRQETPENCTLGLRSRDAVDVASVAARFGGGGHKNAAGATVPGTIAELEEKLLAAFRELWSGE